MRARWGLILFAGGLILTAATGTAIAQSNDDDPVIATVGDTTIHRSDFVRAYRNLPEELQDRGPQAVYREILERLIQQVVVIQEGRKAGLADDPDVQARLRPYEDQIIHDVFLLRQVSGNLTDELVRQSYDEWVQRNAGQEEIKARHILVETEEKARELIGRIATGEPFAELARTHSIGPSAVQGGDLGYFTRDRMVPEFAEVAFALQPNQYSADPVRSQFGWHIILVEDRREAAAPSFEEMRPHIRQQLGERMALQLSRRLAEQADVQRFDLEGNPLPAPSATQ